VCATCGQAAKVPLEKEIWRCQHCNKKNKLVVEYVMSAGEEKLEDQTLSSTKNRRLCACICCCVLLNTLMAPFYKD
jgi:ribosomal protein L37AE/L43A